MSATSETTKSLSKLQASVAARLGKFSEFAGIRIVTERLKDFASELQKILGGLDPDYKTGIFLAVGTPTIRCHKPQVPGPPVKVSVTVTVSENLIQNESDNGSRIPAADIALDVLRCLSGFQPIGAASPLLSLPVPARVVEDPFDPERLCYLVSLECDVCLPCLRLVGEGAFVKES